MNDIPLLAEHGQLTFRWIHFVAGVLWIGLLYYFNWVNGAFMATLDAETKRKVVPELMPRALFWFRWGAAWTWITGVLLAFVVYYIGPVANFYDPTSELVGTNPSPAVWGSVLLCLIVGFAIYDLIFKTIGKTQHAAGVVLWGLVVVGFAWLLRGFFDASGRATIIHVGALLGTSMAANVWMRIWPAQRRIITATKNGNAPDPADPVVAGLRSKHNTYMSVPLLLFMVGVDQAALTGANVVLWTAIALVIGFAATYAIYKKVPSVKGF